MLQVNSSNDLNKHVSTVLTSAKFWNVAVYNPCFYADVIGLEFCYSQSPPEVQGYTMGMYLVTNGVGFLLGSALLVIVNSATQPGVCVIISG